METTQEETKPKRGRPVTGRKLDGASISLPPKLKQALEAEASAKSTTFAALVRGVLERHAVRFSREQRNP